MNLKKYKQTTIITLTILSVIALSVHATVAELNEPNTIPDKAGSETDTFFNSEVNMPGLDTSKDAAQELFIKTMSAVLVVIVLGIAAMYASRKLLPRIANLPGKQIRIVETAYLGPRKAVHLIEVAGQRLLIGSTNERVATLAHLSDAWHEVSDEHTNQEGVKTDG